MAIVTAGSPPTTPAGPATPEVVDPLAHPYRLTVDRYYQMVESGIFTSKDPVYLWKGRLVEKMSRNRPHSYATGRLGRIMNQIVPAGWFVDQEQPMAIPDDGVPEPDLTVIRGADSDFKSRWVTAADVALVVEVADSSLGKDRGTVMEAYAAARIPVYWIVNLRDRLVEVYTDPEGGPGVALYRTQRTFGPDQAVPVILDGRAVGQFLVGEILP